MEGALAERAVREAAACGAAEVIPSTSGEPLLWDGLDRLVDVCTALGLRLNVTTNGTFPGRGAAEWAERLVAVASDVKISWNGATAATAGAVMRGLDLGAAVLAVRAFVAVRDARARPGRRCRVSFQVTAQETNVAELAEIVRLAASLGVERVKVNQLQLRFPRLAARSLHRSAGAIRRWNEAVRAAHAAADAHRLASGERVLLENVVPLAEDPAAPAPAGPCRFVGREGWVWPDGRFLPCPNPAAERGELGEFGSLAEKTFGELWNGERFRRFVERWEEHAVCRECPFRRVGGA